MQYAQMFSVSAEWIAQNVYGVVTALIVFLVGWYLADLLSRLVHGAIRRTPASDPTIAPVLAELTRYAVIAVTLVIVLGQFGVQTASILAVLGAVGLAIALALQGTLSNMAAGIMLLWLRPFNVGEYIDAEGISGTVLVIGLFATRLRTYDGIFVFAPNQRLWNAKIINYSRQNTRMVETKVGIGCDADIGSARNVLLAEAGKSKALADPAPSVFVSGLGTSSIDLVLRVWVNSADWWDTKILLAERSKTALDEAGIEVAFNRLELDIRSLPDNVRELGTRPGA
jgi:small conductance mechanosensitive channel